MPKGKGRGNPPGKDFSNHPAYRNTAPIELDTYVVIKEGKAMHQEVVRSKDGSGPFIGYQEYYERKYPYLFSRCPRWFDAILKNELPGIMNVFENMIQTVSCVQEGSVSRYQADVSVGQQLFDKYVAGKFDGISQTGEEQDPESETDRPKKKQKTNKN